MLSRNFRITFLLTPCTGCTTISLAFIQHRAVSNLVCQTLHILSFFRFLSVLGNIFYPEVCFFMVFEFACYPLVDVLLLLIFMLLQSSLHVVRSTCVNVFRFTSLLFADNINARYLISRRYVIWHPRVLR